MRVDQAGEKPGIAEINDLDAGGLQLAGGTYLRDALTLNEHGQLVPGQVRPAIDQVGSLDEDALDRPRRCRRVARRLGEEEQNCNEHGAAPSHGTIRRRNGFGLRCC